MQVKEKLNLKKYNSYQIDAICSKAYFPNSIEEIKALYKIFDNEKIILLGSGNNIILSKQYFSEPFIIFNNCFNDVIVKEEIIEAEAGAFTYDLSKIALENSLSGFEIFYDIPSSVGGAVVMNAGASGEEIKDILLGVQYLDLEDNQVKEIAVENINFEYRNSFFQRNTDKVVLKAWFKLKKGNQKDIESKMLTMKEKRWAKQPRNFPNCGSVFKRPSGHFVGEIIDKLGLKGHSIGGAAISNKHSGFIVNLGNATGADIISLIQLINEEVYRYYGFYLDIEQRII